MLPWEPRRNRGLSNVLIIFITEVLALSSYILQSLIIRAYIFYRLATLLEITWSKKHSFRN